MAVTWTISQLDRHPSKDGLDDVVFCAHWRASDSETVGDVEHTGGSYGTASFGDADPDNFTAYADITEADAIAWTKAALGDEEVASIEANIARQITESKTPVVETGLPW